MIFVFVKCLIDILEWDKDDILEYGNYGSFKCILLRNILK
jgi:hypothetical protein